MTRKQAPQNQPVGAGMVPIAVGVSEMDWALGAAVAIVIVVFDLSVLNPVEQH